MNLKSPLRRTTAVAVGALIGLAGVVALAAPASAHAPVLKGQTTCAEADGSWKVDWSVANDFGLDAYIREVTPSNLQLPDGDIKVGAKVDPNYANPVKGTSTFTGDEATGSLKVSLKWTDDFIADETVAVNKPATCTTTTPPTTQPTTTTPPTTEPTTTPPTTEPTTTPPTTEPTPEPTPSYGEAKPIFEITCDSMTIGLDNPADGVELTLVLKPSKGDEKTLTVKPGEKKTVTFAASEGFKLEISLKGYEGSETIAWEAPDDCDTAGGGGSDEPSLPLTGAAAGSIAAGAGVLLAAGLGLFFMARRRKLKFTA